MSNPFEKPPGRLPDFVSRAHEHWRPILLSTVGAYAIGLGGLAWSIIGAFLLIYAGVALEREVEIFP